MRGAPNQIFKYFSMMQKLYMKAPALFDNEQGKEIDILGGFAEPKSYK